MICILAGQLSASAEGSVVIQKVTKDAIIYEEASTNSAEIGELSKGSFVSVTQASKGWTHIQTPEQEGYVTSDVLVKLKSEGYLVIQKGGTTLFTAPSQHAQHVGQLYEGRMIYVYGTAPWLVFRSIWRGDRVCSDKRIKNLSQQRNESKLLLVLNYV